MILQWIRSLVFIIQMYLVMIFLAIIVFPISPFSINVSYWGVHTYSRWVRWSAKVLVGLKSDVRGEVPQDNKLICAKHQSFFDILIICSVIKRPRFVMKKQILRLPIVGYYAKRIGCIPIDRGKGSVAVQQMLAGIQTRILEPGPLIIYPQGTRVAPGIKKKYKIGAGILYEYYKTGCVPAATNVGLFWPKSAIMRRPGLAIVEFLSPIEGGLPKEEFMRELEHIVEHKSDCLMHAGGFQLQK